MSQAGRFVSGGGGGGGVSSITGEVGGAVGPDGGGNINLIGSGPDVLVTGTPGTNTLTISVTGTGGITTLTGNVGGAVSGDGFSNIDITGDGDLNVSGFPGTNELIISNLNGESITSISTDNGGVIPTNGEVEFTSSSMTISGAGNVVTFEIDDFATDFLTNAGVASPVEGLLDILGDATNINTSGVGKTVTITLASNIVVNSVTATSGDITSLSLSTITGKAGTTSYRTLNAAGTLLNIQAFNTLAAAYENFVTCTSGNPVLFNINTATTIGSNYIYRKTGDDVEIADGGTARSSFDPYAVVCGGTAATNPLQQVASLGTAGFVLTSNGAASLPSFQASGAGASNFVTDSGTATQSGGSISILGGTGINTSGAGNEVTVTLETPVTVPNGGSARTTATAYSVICGGTTSTNPHQSVASVGSSGQVLTSNGASALPSFQTLPGSTLNYVTVTLTSADILAITVTPKTLIAAPGGLNYIQIFDAWFEKAAGTVAYINGSTGLAIRYQNATGRIVREIDTPETFIRAAAANTLMRNSYPTASSSSTATSGIINQPVVFGGGSTAFTAGDSVFYMHIWYGINTLGA